MGWNGVSCCARRRWLRLAEQLLGRRLREGLHCGYGIADLAKYITIDACYAIEKRRYKVEGTTGENQHAEATALFKKTIWYSKEMILCWPRKSVN
uniref:Uncharacterized protein n=1 Tax=Oryza meridionalis TaxID=40149 RepID=A0A0E0ENA2_9ORYZ